MDTNANKKEQKKSKSEIVKKCHVSSEELKEFIEINRIIEELDDIEELIKN